MSDAGKVIERVLRCLAAVIEAAPGCLNNAPASKFKKACDAYHDCLAALGSFWTRLNQRMEVASQPFEKAACAKEWLIANFEKDALTQLQAFMSTIRQQAAIVTSRFESSTARCA